MVDKKHQIVESRWLGGPLGGVAHSVVNLRYYNLSISNPAGIFGFFQILPDRASVLSSIGMSGSGRPSSACLRFGCL
jgi:hypothetical protein